MTTYGDKFFNQTIQAIKMSGKMREKLKGALPKATISDLQIAYEAGLLSDEVHHKLVLIAPPVVKINGALWLVCETKGEHDFIGDGCDLQTATELQNISEEMATGGSYSIYVSAIDWFELASSEEVIKVKEFLESL